MIITSTLDYFLVLLNLLLMFQGGSAIPVTLGKPKQSKQRIPLQDIENLVVQLGLSQFKTQNLLHSLRRSGVQFEPYMEKKLTEKSQLLTDFYEVQQVTF